jgi:hypothetical protein
MFSKTPYRQGADKYALLTWLALATILLSGLSIYDKSLIGLSIMQSSFYAFASSIAFAHILTCHHSSILLVKQETPQQAFGGRVALGGMLWVLSSAVALGYFFLMKDNVLQGALYLAISGTTLMVFSAIFRKHLHTMFYKKYEVEQVKLTQSRLVEVYKTYSQSRKPTLEDEMFYKKAMNPKSLSEALEIKNYFDLKALQWRQKQKLR